MFFTNVPLNSFLYLQIEEFDGGGILEVSDGLDVEANQKVEIQGSGRTIREIVVQYASVILG